MLSGSACYVFFHHQCKRSRKDAYQYRSLFIYFSFICHVAWGALSASILRSRELGMPSSSMRSIFASVFCSRKSDNFYWISVLYLVQLSPLLSFSSLSRTLCFESTLQPCLPHHGYNFQWRGLLEAGWGWGKGLVRGAGYEGRVQQKFLVTFF